MKRLLIMKILVISFLFTCFLSANTEAKYINIGTTSFKDVEKGSWYEEAVEWAVFHDVTTGTTATTFSPGVTCTRGQMVTFLWRAAGSPAVKNASNPFGDVPSNTYYFDAVLWAANEGITSGTSKTTFSPNATVTRAQVVTLLWRIDGSKKSAQNNPFTDVDAKAYYKDAVLWALEKKVTAGMSATIFAPNNGCTRSQIVTFLYRFYGHPQAEAVRENEINATCETPGSYDEVICCSICHKELSRVKQTVKALGHKEVIDPAVDATCTEVGKTEGKHCSVCDTVLAAQQDIPAKGHQWDDGVVTKAPTVSTTGIRLYTCNRCGETKEEIIPATSHAHQLTMVPAVSSTCTEAGNIAYYICACGKWFLDAEGKNEITDRSSVITPAKDHTEVIDPAVEATCTETGKSEGKHCSVCHAVLEPQRDTPAQGHQWDNGVVTKEPTATTTGIKLYTCTRCGETKEDTIPETSHVHQLTAVAAVAATCTEPGNIAYYTCTCEHWFVDAAASQEIVEKTSVIIPAKGHTEVIDPAIDANCTEAGKTEGKHCSVCHEILVPQQDVPAKGHTEVIDPAIAATCTETGKTEGKHCSVCHETLVPQQDVPAKGHTEAAAVHENEVAATCTEAGSYNEVVYCVTCEQKLRSTSKTLPALGHDFQGGVCSRCGELENAEKYTVTFVDHDGTVISTQSVTGGKDAALPPNPSRTGYYFAGWNGKYQNITQAETVIARYVAENSANILCVPSAQVSPGEQFSVMFSLEGAVEVCEFDLVLKFDPAILELVAIDDEQNLSIVSGYSQTTGEIKMNYSNTKDRTRRADIAELTFKVKEGVTAKDTVIRLSEMKDFNKLNDDPSSGMITVGADYAIVDGEVHIK